jgi:hypothetical protein
VLRCRSVEMERLRIEFRSKAIDWLFVDAQAPGAKGLSHRKVLEVLFEHSTILLNFQPAI